MKQSDTQPNFEKLMAEGFVEMRIIQEKNSKCPFLLRSKDGNTYEVEGIETKIPNIQANTNIYVKFSPSRRTSQCNGQPITIEEIQIIN